MQTRLVCFAYMPYMHKHLIIPMCGDAHHSHLCDCHPAAAVAAHLRRPVASPEDSQRALQPAAGALSDDSVAQRGQVVDWLVEVHDKCGAQGLRQPCPARPGLRLGWQGGERQARRGKVRQGGEASQGEARRGEARRNEARPGEARRGEARRNESRRGKARQDKAREGKRRSVWSRFETHRGSVW